jgi:hypothetical protein
VSSSISLRLSTRLNIFSGQESSIAVRLRAGAFSSQSHRAAHLYILKRVMHDWSDDVCAEILRRCRDAVAKDQRIVIDAVVPPGNAPHLSKTVDLLMMYCWMVASAPRNEFAELFGRA